MYTLLMILFIIVTIFLAIFILLQQGKGDSLGNLGGGTQMLFGGSGGKSFFEKVTWVLGAVFIFGSLGLAILKARLVRGSRFQDVTVQKKNKVEQPVQAESVEQENSETE